MNEKKKVIRLFNFSHPLMETEIFSLLGHKYSQSLPFDLILTNDYQSAQVILWDGVINPKKKIILEKMMNDFQSEKVLFLLGESSTIYKDQKFIDFFNSPRINFISLPGWNVLPEEILTALETCFGKLSNV